MAAYVTAGLQGLINLVKVASAVTAPNQVSRRASTDSSQIIWLEPAGRGYDDPLPHSWSRGS